MKNSKIKRVDLLVPIRVGGSPRSAPHQRQLTSNNCELSFQGVNWLRVVFKGVTTLIPTQNIVQVILDTEE